MRTKRRPIRRTDPERAVARKIGRRGCHRLRRLAKSDLAENLAEEQRGHLVWRPHHD